MAIPAERAGANGRRRAAVHSRLVSAGAYQSEPLSWVSLASSASRLSCALPLPARVSCTADQKSLETSLYLVLAGADGRGAALAKASFSRGMIGCALATSASS